MPMNKAGGKQRRGTNAATTLLRTSRGKNMSLIEGLNASSRAVGLAFDLWTCGRVSCLW
jgi:hypothetical protein